MAAIKRKQQEEGGRVCFEGGSKHWISSSPQTVGRLVSLIKLTSIRAELRPPGRMGGRTTSDLFKLPRIFSGAVGRRGETEAALRQQAATEHLEKITKGPSGTTLDTQTRLKVAPTS